MKDLIENTFASVLGWDNLTIDENVEDSYNGFETKTILTKIAGNGRVMQYKIDESVWVIIQDLSLLTKAYRI